MQLISLCLALTVCFLANAGNVLPYKIEGRVGGETNSRFAYLYIFATYVQPAVFVRASIENGVFIFNGSIQQSPGTYSRARIFLHDKPGLGKKDYPALLQSAKGGFTDVIVEAAVFVDITPGSPNAIIKGGELNKANSELTHINERNSRRTDSLRKWYQGAVRQSNNNPKVQIALRAAYGKYTTELTNIRTSELLQFIRRNPSSLIAREKLNSFASATPASRVMFLPDMEEIVRVMPGKWLLSGQGKLICREITAIRSSQQLKPGTHIPDYFFTENTDTLAIREMRGQYFLLYFWTSWCTTCNDEQPELKSVYKRFSEKGFNILQVSLDSGMENWKKALAWQGVKWKQVRCINGWDPQIRRTFEIYGVPSNYLIDPEGIIVARDLHARELEEKLADVIK